MSRTISAVAITMLACAFFVLASQAVLAEKSTDIFLPYSFHQEHTDITVYLDKLEVSDFPMGTINTTNQPEGTQWIRLWYHYQNDGNETQLGYLNVKFIDNDNNTHEAPEGTYTGENTGPQKRSIDKFLEFPLSEGKKITKIVAIQGFEEFPFDVPEAGTVTPTATPTAVPATATPLASASSSPGSCLPLLPFAILGTIGLAGLALGKGRKK